MICITSSFFEEFQGLCFSIVLGIDKHHIQSFIISTNSVHVRPILGEINYSNLWHFEVIRQILFRLPQLSFRKDDSPVLIRCRMFCIK